MHRVKAPRSGANRGWLQYWEGRGIGKSRGHVIAEHVGKSDADLIARLASNKKISAASTFTDQATAEAVIGSAIRQNRQGGMPVTGAMPTSAGPLFKNVVRQQGNNLIAL